MDKNWKPEHKPASAPTQKRTEKQNDEQIAQIAQDEFSDEKPSKHHDPFSATKTPKSGSMILKILAGAAIIIALAILFIMPALKGYGVYKAMKASGVPENYATDMASLQKAKEDAQAASTQAAQDIATCEAAKQQAESAKADAEGKAQQFSDAADQMQSERDTCVQQSKDNEVALADAANRLCCISRFTNPTINAYIIADNSVACVSEGGTAVSC